MYLDKLFNKDELVKYLIKIKKKNFIIGFTNGCFDLLHDGHLSLLLNAKKKCDFLIVGLNSDLSVKLLKGSDRPVDNVSIRLQNLSVIREVDALIVFEEETPLKIINALLPDILFKGADYKYKEVVGSEDIIKNGGKIEFINILKGISTTNIIKKSSI